MRQEQYKHVEEACTAMAVALTGLVAAICKQAAAATSADPISTDTPAAERSPRSAVTKPTDAAEATGAQEDVARPCRRINVYLAGSRGCGTLARTYGAQIMSSLGLAKAPYVIKCGTTTSDLAERLRQIGKDRYGAAVRTASGIGIETGFDAWVAHTITTSREPRDPAITLRPRFIAVDLPPGLTRREFDAALHRALKSRCLTSISNSAVPRRYVAYDLIEVRISAATELYALSPHDSTDGDMLLDAIEDILVMARTQRA